MNIDTLHRIINAVEHVRLCKQELHNAERRLETVSIQCDHRYPNGTDACLTAVNPDGTRTCAICRGTTTRPIEPLPEPAKPAFKIKLKPFVDEPRISVDRAIKKLAIFDGWNPVTDFEAYTVEADAVAEAKERIKAVTKKDIEVIYPRITKVTMR